MTTSYVWVVLLVLTIICILSSVPRKSNIEHFTFDQVLDKKCREITAGSDVKNDYKWGGTGQCQKTQEQCNELPVTCFNTGLPSVKVQDGNGGCRDPDGCRTTACNPQNCYDIRCDVNTGLCSQTRVANVYVAGECKEDCKPSHNSCSEIPIDKWKIVEGKWKKYETKMNYNADGVCVRKYLDGSLWKEEESDDSFRDAHSKCTVGNIVLDETQFQKKENNRIVCANNSNLEWSITDHLNTNTNEFNNRLGRDDNRFLDLFHDSPDRCTLNTIVDDVYTSSYCDPPEPAQQDTYSFAVEWQETNGTRRGVHLWREDGKRLYVKDGESSDTKYIVNNLSEYIPYNGEIYYRCPDTRTPEAVVEPASYHTDKCTNVDEAKTYGQNACDAYCNTNQLFGSVDRLETCICRDYQNIYIENSNCYKVHNPNLDDSDIFRKRSAPYEYLHIGKGSDQTRACRRWNDDTYILDDSDLLDEPICTKHEIKCFGWPNNQQTPGFTKVDGTNCYKISVEDAPDDIYFKPLEGTYQKWVRGAFGRSANLSHNFRYMQISTDDHPLMVNDCESQIQNISMNASSTEVSSTSSLLPAPPAAEGAPAFLPGYPEVRGMSAFSFDIYLQASKNCKVYFLVVLPEYENEITADILVNWYTVPGASRKAYGNYMYNTVGEASVHTVVPLQGRRFDTGINKLCMMLEDADGVRGYVHCQEIQVPKAEVTELSKTSNSITVNVKVDTTRHNSVQIILTDSRETYDVDNLDEYPGDQLTTISFFNNNGTMMTIHTNYTTNSITRSGFDINVVFSDLQPDGLYKIQASKMDRYIHVEHSEIIEIKTHST